MGVDKGDELDIDDVSSSSSSSSSEANQDHNGERLIHTELNLQNNRGDDEEDDLQQFGQTNPMMQRVQEALRSQLQRTKERVRDELLQHEKELRKVRSEREEMGLKLFGLQQQLANVQSNFHKANETYQTLLNSRDENDALIVQCKMALETYAKEVKGLAAHNVAAQTELHRTHTAAAQAKDHNEAIKGDISVARRIAQKTEQDTKELEKGKNEQDLYILSLTERIRPLEEEINVTTRQIETQKGQTFNLRQMIKETSAEFDALGMDTKQILQQWKTSVVALQLRDEGLMAARAALKTIQDETKEIARELSQTQREVVVLTQRKADLIAAGTRQDNESKYLDGLINAIQAEQDIMAQKYESNSKSIVASNDDENRLAMELKKVRGEIATIEQKIKLVDSDRVRLEQLADLNLYEQTTFLKTAKNMGEQGKGVLTKLHESEMIAAKAKNELARLNIEKLNVQQNVFQLQESLKEHLCKLRSIDPVISTYEAEIKRNNSEIDKNMNNADRLNRKYQKILEGTDEVEPVGPLEATIKGLSKKIDEQETYASQAQEETKANEAILIETVTELETIQERNTMMQAKLNILNHKRLRLAQEVHTNDVDVTSLKANIQGVHTCMPRLNDLIKQNIKRQSQLCSEVSIRERELLRVTKDFEQETASLSARITETKAFKNKILSEIVEVEHKLLSLEKNIQLEKETQATLKSLNEESDIVGMEKEVNRMKHRLVQLNRQQEFMVRDMERALSRREDIAVKYSKSCKTKGSIPSKSSSRPLSNDVVEQMIGSFKKELESIMEESNECTNKTREKSKDIDKIKKELEKIQKKQEQNENWDTLNTPDKVP